MNSVYTEVRHWSPREGYATGDALLGLLRDGWQISRAQLAAGAFRAPVFQTTFRRDGEEMTVLVLDGPVARELVPLSATTQMAPSQLAAD